MAGRVTAPDSGRCLSGWVVTGRDLSFLFPELSMGCQELFSLVSQPRFVCWYTLPLLSVYTLFLFAGRVSLVLPGLSAGGLTTVGLTPGRLLYILSREGLGPVL